MSWRWHNVTNDKGQGKSWTARDVAWQYRAPCRLKPTSQKGRRHRRGVADRKAGCTFFECRPTISDDQASDRAVVWISRV